MASASCPMEWIDLWSGRRVRRLPADFATIYTLWSDGSMRPWLKRSPSWSFRVCRYIRASQSAAATWPTFHVHCSTAGIAELLVS